MNKTSKLLESSFQPYMAIIAYKADENYYLESHPINKKGEMMEGRPLKESTLHAIADSIFDENSGKIKFGGFIPENLLVGESLGSGEYKMIWFRKEEQRMIHFTSSLGMKSGIAYVPATIYKATRTELSVYSMKTNSRPKETTKLLRAPYYNVNSGGVCLGNAKVKKPEILSFPNLMQYWEDMFWLSEFSAMHGGNFCKSNGNLVWKRMIENPQLKWSEIDELVQHEHKLTLKSII